MIKNQALDFMAPIMERIINMIRRSLYSEQGVQDSGAEEFPRINKLKVLIKKHISASQSECVMEAISLCKNGSQIDWGLVEQFFMSDGTNLEMMKKIKNHYYNKRSEPARKNTRRNNQEMNSLGLEI